MSFEEQIQEWVLIDNQIKSLSDKINDLREKKKVISAGLFKHSEKSPIININGGKLKFISVNIASPLSYKYVEKSLGEIIKNENQVKQIVSYLKEKREIKNVPEIKRIYNS
jgi:hypothetical protein